jgi:hypothetical protein
VTFATGYSSAFVQVAKQSFLSGVCTSFFFLGY